MALGGGTFVSQNKELPGAYINFVSAASASAALTDRGVVSMPLELDWGIDGEIFTVTNEEFQKNSSKYFGYDYTHEKMKGLRDLFRNIKTLYAYRLNSGGVKAGNTFAEARYAGIRGNDLKIIVEKSVDNDKMFVVKTALGTTVIDEQIVEKAADLLPNDYVTFKTGAALAATASAPLTGGTNGTVDGTSHQSYIDKAESYAFNALGVLAMDDSIKGLYAAFVKRMRDEMGVKFQAVIYNKAADYIGCVNVKNKTTDTGWEENSLVYWVTGIIAGCEVNQSNQNRIYDGEFDIDASFTQTELKNAIKSGEFVLHKVGSDIPDLFYVLKDLIFYLLNDLLTFNRF